MNKKELKELKEMIKYYEWDLSQFEIAKEGIERHIETTRDILEDSKKELNEKSKSNTISYSDMKKKCGHTIYRIKAGKLAWRKNQQYILVIAPKKEGEVDVSEGTIKARWNRCTCIIEWDEAHKCIRGIGEDFGTTKGQYGVGDITPWIVYRGD